MVVRATAQIQKVTPTKQSHIILYLYLRHYAIRYILIKNYSLVQKKFCIHYKSARNYIGQALYTMSLEPAT